MSERRLRVPVAGLSPGVHALPPDAARYVTRVHRLRLGDTFIAFDPELALEAEAELASIDRRGAAARFGAAREALLRPSRRVTLVQSLGKGDRFDHVIRDATELGATRIVPAVAARSVVRIGSRDAEKRAARYRKIAIEAARQCGRGDAPAVEAVVPLQHAVSLLKGADVSAFWLDPEADSTLGPALAAAPPENELVFVVGPEGGFTAEEVGAAERGGAQRVTLGPLVLRTETVCAAILGAAIIVQQMRG